jgi:hypothetical protein
MNAFSCIARSVAALLLALAVWLPASARAQALASYDAHAPSIAYSDVHGRGLMVYEQSGRIYGRLLDGQGRPITDSTLILPVSPASRARYANPTVIFKSPQNLFYVAASQSYPTTLNFPSGPVTFNTADGIAAVMLDATATALAYTTQYTPGFLRNPTVTDAEAKPVLVADNYNDPNCCVMLGWQDARDPGVFLTRQLRVDLNPFDSAVRRVPAGAAFTANLAATYDPARDRFVFAYDSCGMRDARCVTGLHSIKAVSGAAATPLRLPMRFNGVPTTPAITYALNGDRYVLATAWRDTALIAQPGGVSAHILMPNVAATAVVEGSINRVGCAVCGYLATARPQVAPIGNTGRVMVGATSAYATGSAEQFVGYRIDVATLQVLYGFEAYSPAWSSIPYGRLAYAADTNRMIGVWEQQRLDGAIWSVSYVQ